MDVICVMFLLSLQFRLSSVSVVFDFNASLNNDAAVSSMFFVCCCRPEQIREETFVSHLFSMIR